MFKKNLEAQRSNHLKHPEKHSPNRMISTILKKSAIKIDCKRTSEPFLLTKSRSFSLYCKGFVSSFHFNSYQSIISEHVWSAMLAMWEANKS
ncbi:hypothetical protein K450DRAFT_254065 [Umbelopsis ramanniana AG]|uniref:Uncharacterized protein n=1 Tax=Umbelopsis ramanniana AG TaxID=1314678 RepID=A0AAD5HAF1_UMBRA|nr:uncharacterized protein K450DRAFT_254065 [Umbelopsis ramanniana AG]KAI8577035.1 hypothetical protein K450DRAFT_254065 [Umbelopsis ramanniana AG]